MLSVMRNGFGQSMTLLRYLWQNVLLPDHNIPRRGHSLWLRGSLLDSLQLGTVGVPLLACLVSPPKVRDSILARSNVNQRHAFAFSLLHSLSLFL
jgi:hypothetical protein